MLFTIHSADDNDVTRLKYPSTTAQSIWYMTDGAAGHDDGLDALQYVDVSFVGGCLALSQLRTETCDLYFIMNSNFRFVNLVI